MPTPDFEIGQPYTGFRGEDLVRIARMTDEHLRRCKERWAAERWATVPPPDARSAEIVDAIRERYAGQEDAEARVGAAIAYAHWRRRLPWRWLPAGWGARRFAAWLPTSSPKKHAHKVR
jgi:hypothetical protein